MVFTIATNIKYKKDQQKGIVVVELYVTVHYIRLTGTDQAKYTY